ncbi:LysE family translocator [Marinoscillum sp. MHG1-6]|uniref:LysE family translocator n=1 Tax=Marinoscillum sp. MHG1-6 TaxID=2959627 RepID=UPI0021589EAC|nr:LysE family translocator [Marinoscillum sp. MHG1-6]
MPPYINGLIFGLIFIFSFGPGFFSLIQTSVQKGLSKAIFLAVGISLSDIIYVACSVFGLMSLLERDGVRMWIAIGGTIVLIAYGIYSWYRKPRIYKVTSDSKIDSGHLKYILKGILLNGLNPFILLFWIGIIGIVSVKHDYSLNQQIIFFSGVLTTILTMDLAKAFLANRLRSVITPRSILIMNRSVGLILILFGIRIIFYLFENGVQVTSMIP